MSRRQRVGVLPLVILSVMLSGATAIAAHHQKGGRNATHLVVASSTTGINAVGDRHYFVRREKEAASRYERRHVLQLRRVAEAKVRAARRQELRANRPRYVSTSTPSTPSGWQAWAASAGVVALRNCENGGSYTTHNSNGYFGAYQFDAQTWYANGGVGDPAYASPAEQDEVAYRLYLSRGSAPWPICGRYL